MASELLSYFDLEYHGKRAIIIYVLANITMEEYYFPYLYNILKRSWEVREMI